MNRTPEQTILYLWDQTKTARLPTLANIEALVEAAMRRTATPIIDPTDPDDPNLTEERAEHFCELAKILDEGDDTRAYEYLDALGIHEASLVSTNILLSRVRHLILGHQTQAN